MPNIQLKEIILYPRNTNLRKKTVKFKTGALNIVYGASQTGKSAIIPIIDYCLGSLDNKIPVGVIRESCLGFAIKLKVDDKELLLGRSLEEGKSKQISYLMADKIDTRQLKKASFRTYKLEELKIHLNDLFGISFLNTEQATTEIEDHNSDRPSYRDLVCFNFQSQNIVANPNCLLYKSDIYYHRQKIKKIFNYAIGAQTLEQLENEYLREQLLKDLSELKYQQNKEENYRKQAIINSELIIYKAMEAGFIQPQKINLEDHIAIENLLTEISKKRINDISFSEAGDEIVSDKIQSVVLKLDELNCKLRGLKQERNDINEIRGLIDKQNNQLQIKKERLEISKFIKEFCTKHNKDTEVLNDVESLCNNLEFIENQLITRTMDSQSGYFKTKLAIIKGEINKIEKEINKNNQIKEILENEKSSKTLLDDIYIDIIGEAKKYLKYITNNNDLSDKIKILEDEVKKLEFDPEESQRIQLNSIIKKANSYLPIFAEFDRLYYFSDKDLTVKVKDSKSPDSHYLWETGSGSNWVAYHIATLLGFHSHFIQKDLPAFNFLIFDQPSQVYFPSTNATYDTTVKYNDKPKKRKNKKLLQSDFECVREMFKVLSSGIENHKFKEQNIQKSADGKDIIVEEEKESKLQIIVLDHAGPDVWENVDEIKNIYPLEEWSLDNRLVPKAWIKK